LYVADCHSGLIVVLSEVAIREADGNAVEGPHSLCTKDDSSGSFRKKLLASALERLQHPLVLLA
jgi:hypothetical protein